MLAVVVYHFAPDRLPGGYLGVDVFFVLSGYLITTGLVAEVREHGRVRLRAFWGRRARRLLPAALLTIAAVAAVGLLWDEARSATRGEMTSALGYVANWPGALGGTSYFDALTPPSPLRHFWSLAIEEQFYVVAPLAIVALVALARRGPWSRWRHRLLVPGVVVAGTAAVVSAILLAVHYGDGRGSARAYYGTDARIFELLVGVLLAIALDRRRVGRALSATAAASLAVLGAGTALVGSDSPVFFRGGAVVVVLATAVVVAACVGGTGRLPRALSARPLAALGVISYGVYLYHWPIARWVDAGTIGVDGLALFAARSAITLAAAIVSFHLIERPLLARAPRAPRLRWRAQPRRVVAVAFVGAAAVLVGACGLAAAPDNRSPLSGPPVTADPTRATQPAGTTATTTFARVVQLAPAAGPWLSIDDADVAGELSFVKGCFGGPPLVSHRDNGAGDLVAVIGDSITTEITDELLDARNHDWLVISSCGLTLDAMEPGAPGHDDLVAALGELDAARPSALVIAFSTNGAGVNGRQASPADVTRDLDVLLDRTTAVPCRMVMNAHPNAEMDRATSHIPSSGLVAVNQALSAPGHEGLTLLDWDASVAATPLAPDGYHPFLDPSDWLHLVPGQGDLARIRLIEQGVATCPR